MFLFSKKNTQFFIRTNWRLP